MRTFRILLAFAFLQVGSAASAEPWSFWRVPAPLDNMGGNLGMFYCPEKQCLVSQGVAGLADSSQFISINNLTPLSSAGAQRGFLPGDTIGICNGTVCQNLKWAGTVWKLEGGTYNDPHNYRNTQKFNLVPPTQWNGCSAYCYVAVPPAFLTYGYDPQTGYTGNLYTDGTIWMNPLINGSVEIVNLTFTEAVLAQDPMTWGDPTPLLYPVEPIQADTTSIGSVPIGGVVGAGPCEDHCIQPF